MGQKLLEWRGRIQEASVDVATAATHELVAAVSGKTVRVYKIWLRLNAANNVTFKTGTTALHGRLDYSASGEIIYDDPDGAFPITCTVSQAFNMTLTAAAQVSGRVWYTQDAYTAT